MPAYTGIFDSHTHYGDNRFDADRDALLEALPRRGIRFVMAAGADMPSSRRNITLAERYDYIYAAVGVHPHDAKDYTPADREELVTLAAHPKVKAIGEIGLDYHYDFSPRDCQNVVFEDQLKLAKSLNMPVIIHDREAHADTLALLQKYTPQGVMHCYSGSAEMVPALLRLGFYIGFTGVVTFKNARKALEAVAAVPLDKLLIETDCPYMAPEPFRGQRCDSSMLHGVVDAIANVKGITPQALVAATCQNACSLFGIPLNA